VRTRDETWPIRPTKWKLRSRQRSAEKKERLPWTTQTTSGILSQHHLHKSLPLYSRGHSGRRRRTETPFTSHRAQPYRLEAFQHRQELACVSFSPPLPSMALISVKTILTSLAFFHITLAFFFITNPATIADQALVFVVGEAMGMVSQDTLASHPCALTRSLTNLLPSSSSPMHALSRHSHPRSPS
jgi:hypothetical protein